MDNPQEFIDKARSTGAIPASMPDPTNATLITPPMLGEDSHLRKIWLETRRIFAHCYWKSYENYFSRDGP